jgi:hypothetical protein
MGRNALALKVPAPACVRQHEPQGSGIVERLPYWTLTWPNICLAGGNFLAGKYPERRIA